MEIKIDGKDYKLHFGVSFIQELDEKFKIDVQVMQFGAGVSTLYAKLQTPNPYPLFQGIHAALNTQMDLSAEQYDEWVDSFKSDKEYTDFFKKFVKQLKTTRQTKPLVQLYEQSLKKAKKETEKAFTEAEQPTEE